MSRALRRRLKSLAEKSEKAIMAVDPGLVPKPGTTLVRQWRGHTHTVLVHNDGFEHEGQRYRSLTAIAERITRPIGRVRGSPRASFLGRERAVPLAFPPSAQLRLSDDDFSGYLGRSFGWAPSG